MIEKVEKTEVNELHFEPNVVGVSRISEDDDE